MAVAVAAAAAGFARGCDVADKAIPEIMSAKRKEAKKKPPTTILLSRVH